jgi:hypothetical protein
MNISRAWGALIKIGKVYNSDYIRTKRILDFHPCSLAANVKMKSTKARRSVRIGVDTHFSSEDDERTALQLSEMLDPILDPDPTNKKTGVSISATSGLIK